MVPTTFNLSTDEVLSHAHDICEEYGRQGFDLTLRQLYYQFVSRGLHGSDSSHYNRLGRVLAKARVRGEFPLSYLVDRGRTVGETDHGTDQTSVASALDSIASEFRRAPSRWLWRSRWFGQSTVPFVWIEKEALAGVYGRTCQQLNVGLFPCKGYPSISALAQFADMVEAALDDGADEIVVLYCGDHDPDGLEIPRAAERTLREMSGNHVVLSDYEFDECVRFERIALTMEQIQEHNAPPFEAKRSSSRYRKYVNETGLDGAWELDALPPTAVDGLIRQHVDGLFDWSVDSDNRSAVAAARAEATKLMASPGWAADALADR